ncbi:probable nucleoredoxin 2 [Daucus carota subsp. sativus]|uniref:probable nucleoredoxin 2 n=1 Tax=Daucus carota subsp. sativus TaxID=79200 RepID=UPI0007F03A59|nr:PREDICTED: probable nucleoredoxin 2 [Daucus carota subsp. sativus]
MRVCHYPLDLDGPKPDPRLVIVGPRGEFFEPYGADIFMNFGVPAYSFSCTKLVDLLVKVSEVAGKGIILLIGINWIQTFADCLSILKSKYELLKGTYDDFEVIQIYNLRELSDYGEHVADVSWPVHPFDEDSPGVSMLLDASGDTWLLTFNRHRQVIKRATISLFDIREDSAFPFSFNFELEKEVYREIYKRFGWEY